MVALQSLSYLLGTIAPLQLGLVSLDKGNNQTFLALLDMEAQDTEPQVIPGNPYKFLKGT